FLFSYVVLLFGFFFPIASWPQVGRHYLFLLLAIGFIGDGVSWVVGSQWGRPRESAFAVLFFSLLVSGIWVRFLYPDYVNSTFFWRVVLLVPFFSFLARLGRVFGRIFTDYSKLKYTWLIGRWNSLLLSTPLFFWAIYYVWE
ncbi:MAG: hypothetical protein ACKN9V_01945, partial [Pseudomonadota bacterium]